MKRILAGLITTILMVWMIWTGMTRSNSSIERASDADSRDRFQKQLGFDGATESIARLLERASAGDVASYLDSFGGALRDRLQREADERGREAFAQRLRRAGLMRKSHAIFAPEADGNRPGTAKVTVESAYGDRIERQTFHLQRGSAGWLVIETGAAREEVHKNQLGSLATYEEPEGSPVVTGSLAIGSEPGEE
jgi:hypothetical protein